MDISLKKYSIDEIQNTIAKSLTDLCGEKINVDIRSLVEDQQTGCWSMEMKATISHWFTYEQVIKKN